MAHQIAPPFYWPSISRGRILQLDNRAFVLQSLLMAQKKEGTVRIRLSAAERRSVKKLMAKVRAAKKRKNRAH